MSDSTTFKLAAIVLSNRSMLEVLHFSAAALASEEFSFVTAQAINICGGQVPEL